MSDFFISVLILLRTISGVYIVVWIFPYMFFGLRASYGNSKYILFMDNQLAKNSKKDHGMTSMEIGYRHHLYSIMYPFLLYRVTTKSIKFKVIMALNAAWFYSIFTFFSLVMISKLLGIH